jgi:hypothetical protein
MSGVNRPRLRPSRAFVRIVLLTILIASWVTVVTISLPKVLPCLGFGLGFDANTWASTDLCNARLTMVDDLVTNHLPDGISRDEVVALLGEPNTAYDGTNQGDRTIAYDMGGWMDTNWLVVQFDDDWLLITAFWYQD